MGRNKRSVSRKRNNQSASAGPGTSPKSSSPRTTRKNIRGQQRIDEALSAKPARVLRSSLRKFPELNLEDKDVVVTRTGSARTVLLKKDKNAIPRSESSSVSQSSSDISPAKSTSSSEYPVTPLNSHIDNVEDIQLLCETASTKPLKIRRNKDTDEVLLKAFDLNLIYGPCRGISRMERLMRVQKFQLKPQPPPILFQLLKEYSSDPEMNVCVWDKNNLLSNRKRKDL